MAGPVKRRVVEEGNDLRRWAIDFMLLVLPAVSRCMARLEDISRHFNNVRPSHVIGKLCEISRSSNKFHVKVLNMKFHNYEISDH